MRYVEYDSRSMERPPGVFISLDALVLTGIAIVALAVTVLIALVPQIGVPVGVGVTVAALLFTVWTQYGRSR
jgi:Flp pilus assembly protein TadB